MTRDDLNAQGAAIVARQLKIDAAAVTAESSFMDDLGADSVDFVELLMVFAEELGAAIPDADAEGLDTFGKAMDYIAAKRGL